VTVKYARAEHSIVIIKESQYPGHLEQRRQLFSKQTSILPTIVLGDELAAVACKYEVLATGAQPGEGAALGMKGKVGRV
jgi:hypothetical protein